jgi:hypothetical protein
MIWNKELERMWTGAIMAYFEVFSWTGKGTQRKSSDRKVGEADRRAGGLHFMVVHDKLYRHMIQKNNAFISFNM